MTPNKEKRTNLLQIRLTEEEQSSLEIRAKKEGMPLSTFVRVRILEYCRKADKEE